MGGEGERGGSRMGKEGGRGSVEGEGEEKDGKVGGKRRKRGTVGRGRCRISIEEGGEEAREGRELEEGGK